jgi:hypothetical protein
MASPPALAPALAPSLTPSLDDRATAGEEVWAQLSRQFAWICVVQASVCVVCGACSGSDAPSARE